MQQSTSNILSNVMLFLGIIIVLSIVLVVNYVIGGSVAATDELCIDRGTIGTVIIIGEKECPDGGANGQRSGKE